MTDHDTAPLSDDPILIDRVRSLCEELVARPAFLERREAVARFMADSEARALFETAMERQRAADQAEGHDSGQGNESNGWEYLIEAFENSRALLLENEVARDFLRAQQDLKNTEAILHLFITRTLQLGRVPNDEDLLPEEGGCCGGGCDCGENGREGCEDEGGKCGCS